MPIINRFGGVFPRMAWHTLPENAATVAHDVKLRNGKLEAWREREPIGFAVADAKSIAMIGCCLLSWDACVTVTDYLPDYGRIFLTGRSDRPEVAVLENCVPEYSYLGVPEPPLAPSVSGEQNDGRDCSARSYIYTYVNEFGEESAPSPPSQQITIRDKTPVSVLGISPPPVNYRINRIRIYRTATAFRDGSEKEQEMITDFFMVGEIPATETSFIDDIWEKNLGPVCSTREVRVPPYDMRQIRHIRGTGVLTGVTNNEVHFSANFQPYNWPAEFDLTLPHNIVNMVAVDEYAIVSTDGYPYVISAAPNCEARKCRPVDEVDIPLPDISCGYTNSAIATPFGMIYSSKDGLVLVMPNAKFQIITSTWFSTDDWIKRRPDTVRLAYWRGYLICVTDVVSFMLEIDGNTYQDFELGSMITISDKPVDMITTDSGELMMLEDRFVYHWNAGKTLREYAWESRELSFGGRASPTVAKIRTDHIKFRLLTPKTGLFYERIVTDENPFHLGRVGRHLNYRMGFYGTGTVEFANLGMMMTTINEGR